MAYNKLSLADKIATKTRPDSDSDCLLWVGQTDARGYGILRSGSGRKRAHRLVYELVHGPIPPGLVIRHKCDTPECVEASHLEIGTQLDNVRDMFDRGRANKPKGSDNAKSRLSEEQVREIRASYQPRTRGKGSHCLAKRFGVSKPTIRAILSGESWRHLK